ncbi:hypothetical protein ACV3Q3_12925 [Clostridium perfringens]
MYKYFISYIIEFRGMNNFRRCFKILDSKIKGSSDLSKIERELIDNEIYSCDSCCIINYKLVD